MDSLAGRLPGRPARFRSECAGRLTAVRHPSLAQGVRSSGVEAATMSRIKRLLVPTDFSPTAELALQYAIDIAPPGASIHVIHVIEDTAFVTAFPDGFTAEIAGLREQAVKDAKRTLAGIVGQFQASNTVLTTEVLTGRPVAGIVETAKARNADLIVMGTHGRGGFAHFMLGSVAERVLRTAQCPVLTIRDNSRVADALAEEVFANRQAALA
jgi:nucleotide-binding universal stress UspA family protein